MKTLLSIVMLAILCAHCVPEFNGSVLSALNNTNIARLKNVTAPETTTPLELRTCLEHAIELLKCHVCMGSFQCLAPQDCAPNEKFCMIAETGNKSTHGVIKYCSIMCPFIDKFYGRTIEDWYLACCAQDLCNYKKLGNGHRLCASALVVTMTFTASLLGTLRIAL